MKFCFPRQFPTLRQGEFGNSRTLCLNLPYIFNGEEYDLGDVSKVTKLYAPTEILFERCDYYYRIKFVILGFGLSYSRQWGY